MQKKKTFEKKKTLRLVDELRQRLSDKSDSEGESSEEGLENLEGREKTKKLKKNIDDVLSPKFSITTFKNQPLY